METLNTLERRYSLVSDIKLLKTLYNNPKRGLSLLMDNYNGLVYTIVSNQLSNILSNKDIEECVSYIFFEVFNHKGRINLENIIFVKVLNIFLAF